MHGRQKRATGDSRVNEKPRATFPIVVHTLLVQSGRWFLVRRANTGYLDGAYTLPGGHVRRGEGVVAAALRECREEAGVDIVPADLELIAAMPYQTADLQGVDFIARATRWAGTPRVAEPHHFDDCCWAEPGALPDPLAPFIPALVEMQTLGAWFKELID